MRRSRLESNSISVRAEDRARYAETANARLSTSNNLLTRKTKRHLCFILERTRSRFLGRLHSGRQGWRA
jgi:hypothetical protein